MVAYGPGVGSMLASNADRDRAVDVLRAGFAEGRLTQPEFEDRVARVHTARTYDQLTELTCDLPAGPWAFAGTAMVPYHDPAVSYRDSAVSFRDRMAESAEPSFANLALTALVMFALAAIVTALTVYAHIHGQAFAPSPAPGSIHLQPYIQHLHVHHRHMP
jgi:hypothetical protein